ncbi:MAG: CoA-binding protein [Candidatus Omnitrophica bacterium]|nr:CoA-binding protein [Candidatus Omnitrophota bacterium]
MESLIKDFLKQKRFAIVGSFRNEAKYAYKILKTLIKKGYEAFPVNPRLSDVDGIKCYKSISDIPFNIDVVNVVTPPSVTETIVKECRKKSIKRVWLQPGAESETAIKFCRDNNIDVIYGLCVMLESS